MIFFIFGLLVWEVFGAIAAYMVSKNFKRVFPCLYQNGERGEGLIAFCFIGGPLALAIYSPLFLRKTDDHE